MKILPELYAFIADRQANPLEGSYTNQLLADRHRAAQKVGEEGVEVVIASLAQSAERLTSESADLLFHLLVLLVQNGVTLEMVTAELDRRRK